MKSDKQKEDDLLARRIVSFIRWINSTFEHPENWPMTDRERISFLKETYFRAKEIQNSEGFARLQLLHALGSLAASKEK